MLFRAPKHVAALGSASGRPNMAAKPRAVHQELAWPMSLPGDPGGACCVQDPVPRLPGPEAGGLSDGSSLGASTLLLNAHCTGGGAGAVEGPPQE